MTVPSRFTEHFDINEPWELLASEPSSPTTSSLTSFYFSSTETLNIDCQYGPTLVDDDASSHNYQFNKAPSLIHTSSYTSIFSNQSEPTESKTVPIVSKLKRLLSTVSTKRSSRSKNRNSYIDN